MKNEALSPQATLLAELERRRSRNSRYTLRAFARDLGLPAGRVSELMTGRRSFTIPLALKVAAGLELAPDARQIFLDGVDTQLKIKREAITCAPLKAAPEYKDLPLDSFHVISDWYHFAILSLMDIKDFEPTSEWISKRLGITLYQADEAVTRLIRIGLIEVSARGRWKSTGRNIQTPSDVASVALKKSHRQSLEQAISALQEVPLEKRDITSMTMAIDSRRLPEAKKLIKKFRQRLAAFLEGGSADEVYNINIQLIPLTKQRAKGKEQ